MKDGGVAMQLWRFWSEDGAGRLEFIPLGMAGAAPHWAVDWSAVQTARALDHPVFGLVPEPHEIMTFLHTIALQANESDASKLDLIEGDGAGDTSAAVRDVEW